MIRFSLVLLLMLVAWPAQAQDPERAEIFAVQGAVMALAGYWTLRLFGLIH